MADGTDTMTPLRALKGLAPAPRTNVRADLKPTSISGSRIHLEGKFFSHSDRRFRPHGVTYGPFAPYSDGHPFPAPDQVRHDFVRMRDAGINAIRTYHVPPVWLLELAHEHGVHLFVDVPWRKHLCFLESATARAEAREAVRAAAKWGGGHPAVFAYSVGNEIPTDVIRWHGTRKVERFLAELADVAHQADPGALVTYASYPPTEYLDLSPFDFVTFNVYLHDPEAFRRYLFRLQNLIGDKPLVLGEIGMDSLRQGEDGQAAFLAEHIPEARLAGVAGLFVFSWTDDWFTGGHRVEDWAFGITRADRSPKSGLHAVRESFEASLSTLLPKAPRTSVVVCTYNGGRTLDQCLRSMRELDYPDFEIIVVDDGSTDDTSKILRRFPEVRAISQANRGLSAARNAGLAAATGEVVAYTDSDCFVDPDWLTHLTCQLGRIGAAGVGGPNLTPEDGRLAACVAASPGQPTHVLEADQVAEHIPGCNMAYRREALLAVNGFDPAFRKAGDDVDLCWRLQQAGYWMTFAPGAFVWHHRRQNPRAYLKQQAGYGEAEALLRFKHPHKFNRFGDGKWRGTLYGLSLRGVRLGGEIIYRGTYGCGLFQCLYQKGPAHWAMLPSTLEWYLVAASVGLIALVWPLAWAAVGVMFALSVAVAAVQAVQAHVTPEHDGPRSRLIVAALCYAQPLVRSWARYRTRLFYYRPPGPDPSLGECPRERLPLGGKREVAYWSEEGRDRTELLDRVVGYLNVHRWGKTIDTGWSDWDLEVHCDPWTVVQLGTAQENHAEGKRLIRVRYRLRASGYLKALLSVSVLPLLAAAGLAVWSDVAAPLGALAVFGSIWALSLGLWWRGTRRAAQALAVVGAIARKLDLVRCAPPAGSGGGL